MTHPSALNSHARRAAQALSDAFPRERFAITVLEAGHLEASLEAPSGARSGALVVLTAGEGDVWIRLAPPNAFYSVDDDQELVRVVRAILNDDALFALIYEGDEWAGTTLISPGQRPPLEPNQRAVVLSWSGKQDADIF
jgi:hypothetical protein